MGFGETLLKIISALVVLAIVGVAVVSILVLNDISDFQMKFLTEDKLFFLDINGNIRGAFEVGSFTGNDAPFHPIPQDALYEMTAYYIAEKHDELLGSKFKTFAFHEEAFDEVEDVRVAKKLLPKKDVIRLLKSASIMDDFEPIAGFDPKTINEVKDDGSLRYYLFARLVFTPLEDRGPIYIIEQVKKNNIDMYPSSITFKLLKYIPIKYINLFITQDVIDKVTATK